MTPWVLRLVIANVLVFLLQANPAVTWHFRFVPQLILVQPWTTVTYMFLHADPMHLLFNMLGLWIVGPPLESRLGGRRFLALYFISGITGALLSLVSPNPIIGASAAVMGVMLGFARFWPRQQLLIWGIVPVEARWLVVGYAILEIVSTRTPGLGAGIAHYAHLGGFLGGWLYLEYLARFTGSAAFRRKAAVVAPVPRRSAAELEKWKSVDPTLLHPVNREEYERVMAKINTTGLGSLSAGEREFLDRFSARA